ncbi:MAG: adenosine kinase [Bacteroidales bacterium]|nr:adenosine kinase [Bacteroidales bacterium]
MAKVLGMGNALIDIMTQIDDDSVLEKFGLPKGSMQLKDCDFIQMLEKNTSDFPKQLTSGGSAANTIHGLANMGIETGFMGKVGKDEYGEFFKTDIINQNISPNIFYGNASSGKAFALISPDSERTFATYLGASIELCAEDLKDEYFKGYDIFYIEGYLVQNHNLIKKAVELAKKNGLKVSLDLASFNIVEENIEFLKKLILDYVDIIFANEEEAKAFTGKEPDKALDIISEMCEIAIVKIGKKGSIIKKDNNIYKIGIVGIDALDTTGAGDLYAAGFIYGLIKGLDMDKCGQVGSILSGKVIEVVGAKIETKKWVEIREIINKL